MISYINICKCGCGNMTFPVKQFMQGHYNRGNNKYEQ